MHIQEHILSTVPVFDVTDTLDKAISFFEETTYSHVAIKEEGVFVGLLSENDLACFEPDKSIDTFRYDLESFHGTDQTSWLDLLEQFARNEANLLPVLDASKRVLGYYDLNDVVSVFIGTPFFTEPGGIIVVSKGIKDYSFSEIAQIVETNNSKLLGAFITETANDMVQVTLKTNATHLNEIFQTFRRYSYTIEFGNNDDQFLEDLKERSDYLDKYLNV
ncbi:Acetoin utilization protein [Croceitalea dokdonensis DOKDO 023]|uniref:Acetoin utilization protein n=1 Tax=Croceitalea dokdonensis DOKDO 023 TaxID=1300341 RepID=A0A0P7AWS1_9FLAO|nr:CBS domain-containing protein [Croceitalea dokdonensis]KPM32464.1 Acetoin utilization protein [Croceitalea dokdonensis DOKDO 023]